MKRYLVVIVICLAFFGYIFYQFFAGVAQKRSDPLTHYDNPVFWKGYEAAQDDVRDWLDENHGYYKDIYTDGYIAGHIDGYDEGFQDGIDHAIDTVDDWYE